jgi:radical SAM superfamily enzyme YgiQ (UPF0313 family)
VIDALLVHPWTGANGKFPPMGLLCLAAWAEREGYEVAICDAAALDLDDAAVVERVRRLAPRCVGVTFMTPQHSHALALTAALRHAFPELVLVAGGVHANVAPEDTLRRMPWLDALVLGEGEVTFAEILAALRRGERGALHRIPGTAAVVDGRFVRAAPRPLLPDLGALPMPAWHLAPLERYTVPTADYVRRRGAAMTIYGSRGCPHRCLFCAVDGVFGRGHRQRRPAQIADEIESLAVRRGIREFMFVDDVLFQDRDHLLALCGELRARRLDVRWAGNARVDSRALDAEVLDAAARAGCVRIDFGVESGSPRVLRQIRKGIALPRIHAAHRLAHRRGLATTTFMLAGHPEEAMEDVRASLRLVAQLDTEHPRFGTETPFPGSPLYDLARANGWLRDADWAEYYVDNARPVMRTRHFDHDQIVPLSDFCRRVAELFGELSAARRRRPWLGRSRLLAALLLGRLISDRFRSVYQRDLTLGARARAIEAFLAKDAEPERFEALLLGISLADLERLGLPSARTLQDLIASLRPGSRVLVAPATGLGAVLPVLRALLAAANVAQVDLRCSATERATVERSDVAGPRLRTPERSGALAGALAGDAARYDAVLVPHLSFRATDYARLLLHLLLRGASAGPIHVVALGLGGNVLRATWGELLREVAARAARPLRARVLDRARSMGTAWRLAGLARGWSSFRRPAPEP